MFRITVTTPESQKQYVMKALGEVLLPLSQALGFAREGLIYSTFADDFGDFTPEVTYSYGDMITGEKFVIMEELKGATSCASFMDAAWPLLDQVAEDIPADWLEQAVCGLAKMQAKFWNDESLLDNHFLQGAEWYKGENAAWAGNFAHAKNSWNSIDRKAMGYSDQVCEIIDAVWAKDSFEDFTSAASSRSFTLAHGDFHPGNIMFHEGKTQVIDWETALVAPGILDLCYMMFQHTVEFRRENWERIVELYVSELAAAGVDYPVEEAKRDFVDVSIRRMTWFFSMLHHETVLPGVPVGPEGSLLDWHHKHFEALIEDFNITPDSVGPAIL
jgi:hypothetical protein